MALGVTQSLCSHALTVQVRETRIIRKDLIELHPIYNNIYVAWFSSVFYTIPVISPANTSVVWVYAENDTASMHSNISRIDANAIMLVGSLGVFHAVFVPNFSNQKPSRKWPIGQRFSRLIHADPA